MAKEKKALPLAIALVVGLVAVGIAALLILRTDKAPEGPAGEYDAFAECLYESGMRMYGSKTCSFCSRQRKLFKGSDEKIREIECDPRNEGSQEELCIEKNVTHTPTWILEDQDGNELRRFDPGVLSLEELSEASGCALEPQEE